MESKLLNNHKPTLPIISQPKLTLIFKTPTHISFPPRTQFPILLPPPPPTQPCKTHAKPNPLDFPPDPTLTNPDLAPTTPSDRTFTWRDLASLWVGLVVGVPTYYLACTLVGLGMSWSQGIATIVLANLILLVPLILTGHAGAKYGIPFPVLARASFGVRGSHLPALLRALVGCGWFGIESWIGGEAVYLLLPRALKLSVLARTVHWLGASPLEFLCFALFWCAQLAIVLRGVEGIRDLEKYAAPVLVFLTAWLVCWACVKAGGLHNMLSMTSKLTRNEFWAVFFPSLTANIGFWATLALNIPDFTRYARTQTDQVIGQVGLPVFMGLFAFAGLAVTSSTEPIFGRLIADPIRLLGEIGGPIVLPIAILGISLATITTNIAANVVAPANALVNLAPAFFTFERGAVLTALLGVAFQPWRLLKSSDSFVYTWLVGYSALLGPIGCIVLVDYFALRHTVLNVSALYSADAEGPYYYCCGYNLGAVAALVIGVLPVVPGFLHKVGVLSSVSELFVIAYNNSWFVGSFVAGFVYWVLSGFGKRQGMGENRGSPVLG